MATRAMAATSLARLTRLGRTFDLLHNFHLDGRARLQKLRVYETHTNPTGREGLRLPVGPWLGAGMPMPWLS